MDQPIACSLSSTDHAQRIEDLAALSAQALLDRIRIDGGQRLVFVDAPGTESGLRTAIDAEAACCAFLSLTLRRDGHRLLLDITGPDTARPIIEQLFA